MSLGMVVGLTILWCRQLTALTVNCPAKSHFCSGKVLEDSQTAAALLWTRLYFVLGL